MNVCCKNIVLLTLTLLRNVTLNEMLFPKTEVCPRYEAVSGTIGVPKDRALTGVGNPQGLVSFALTSWMVRQTGSCGCLLPVLRDCQLLL